ncbi:MAG: uroporphyrinogen-III C-methyltransferase [Caulobacter sp.]|nr:uroporphyrinogen-III C-methyltransferase [Caulobacter sp.]
MSRPSRPAPSSRRLVALNGPAAVPGTVWLVGAGPGDPDLLTVKAARILGGADVVVHDGLVSDAILAMAPSQARLINVAKRKSRHTLPQNDINQLLVALALQGLTVVRLKGGDPFIFGRGGEEMAACRAAAVDCRIVPGVTAALAASASAGAPLTHRGAAQAVTFVTGHAAHGEPDLDWPALARANQTVVIYMGLTTAAVIADRLIGAGRDRVTPALVVVNASREDEQRIPTTLGDLASAVEGLSGPALLMVGEAMALATARILPRDFVPGEGDHAVVEGAAPALNAIARSFGGSVHDLPDRATTPPPPRFARSPSPVAARQGRIS